MKRTHNDAELAVMRSNRARAADMNVTQWDPKKHEESCSNCLHCVVFDDGDEPMARCERGLGRQGGGEKPLHMVNRPVSPYSWMAAAKCPEFTCMSDDCKGHNENAPGKRLTVPDAP